jgi:hypothetical protein
MGVQACPSSETFSAVGCQGGQEAYENVFPGSTYSIDLSPGSWDIADYYRTDSNALTYVGVPVQITVVKETTLTVNVTMKYQGL